LPVTSLTRQHELGRVLAMMALFFLVVCTVGILRPIKNALALDGLAETRFYQVYLVSAAVVLFVPPYNRLADRISWRALIPAVALFFALNLVVFRFLYREGSTAFGMIFYGWYDLYAAALVTQFFIATQLFFTVRDAKRAYPLVIVGGSVGAALGGAITGFFAQRVGTPNLLFVAAALIAAFALALPFVWSTGTQEPADRRPARHEAEVSVGEFRRIFSNPHVRLIALIVLLTVLVKQFVDYQYNEAVAAYQGDRDAIASFQGWVFAIKDWLPILVLISLRPLLKRWGVGVAVFMLPVVMLFATLSLAIWWGVWIASVAKVADSAFRYSAERTGREILYVPVPDDIKLKAKAYIDVAVEKGLGKVLSALLIGALLVVIDYRRVAFVGAALSLVWLAVAVATRREYVKTLARSIQGRFASLRGVFASLTDANTLPILRSALSSGEPVQTAFVLDLLDQAAPADVRPLAEGLHRLLDHPSQEIRARALDVLADLPEAADVSAIRARLLDPEPPVREAAVRALCRVSGDERQVVAELLSSEHTPVRLATLACLARGELAGDGAELIGPAYLEERWAAAQRGDADARLEIALAAGSLQGDGDADRLLESLLADPDPGIASAALRSAARLRRGAYHRRMIAALKSPATREAAGDGLALQGPAVVETLSQCLLDPAGELAVRWSIPAVLARISAQETVDTLLRSLIAPETDQLLDYRTLKALNKLRARHPDLVFDAETVLAAVQREVDASGRYTAAEVSLGQLENGTPTLGLLRRALREARDRRREEVFRCIGLLYPPDQVYRCYLAVVGGSARARANAIEWLEHTVHHTVYSRIAPLLEEGARQDAAGKPEQALRELWDDNDTWVAHCALAAAAELEIPGIAAELARFEPAQPGLRQLAQRLAARPEEKARTGERRGESMELIEKVFLLQNVDLLHDARSSHLGLLATIAEEIEVESGRVLIRRGEPNDALYVVIRGAIELRGTGGQVLEAAEGGAFGTWALIDAEPSVVEARATGSTRLLRIRRSDFQDLLADHVEMAIDLLQGLARRMRRLAAA